MRKNTMKLKSLGLGAFAALAFVGCDEPLDTVGPPICPSNDFSFTSADLVVDVLDGNNVNELSSVGNTVDLSNGGLHIHTKLSEVVQWEMKIGNSGSQRTYSGESDSISIYWYGQGNKFDGTNMSISGAASVEFEIVCQDPIKKDFTITGTQNFTNINPNFGVLIRDWDQNGDFPVAGTSFDVGDGWAGPGGGANPWEFEYYNATPSPAGGYYCQFYGKTAAPAWYMGSTSFPTAGIENTIPTANTDSLFLNFFVMVKDDIKNAGSQIGFQAQNVNYLKTEAITWDGWKLLSYKLSDFKSPSGDPLTTTEIANVVLQLGCQPEAVNELEVRYDFCFITVGEPLFKE